MPPIVAKLWRQTSEIGWPLALDAEGPASSASGPTLTNRIRAAMERVEGASIPQKPTRDS